MSSFRVLEYRDKKKNVLKSHKKVSKRKLLSRISVWKTLRRTRHHHQYNTTYHHFPHLRQYTNLQFSSSTVTSSTNHSTNRHRLSKKTFILRMIWTPSPTKNTKIYYNIRVIKTTRKTRGCWNNWRHWWGSTYRWRWRRRVYSKGLIAIRLK